MIYAGFIFLIPFSLVFAQDVKMGSEKKTEQMMHEAKTDDSNVEENRRDNATVLPDTPSIDPSTLILPEPMADTQEIPAETFEQEEPVGIDTVSLEDTQGNWLFKRIWWERAEDRYGKIRDLVNTIWESRTKFFVQRNELDRTVLDPFYVSIGMGQGELQVILNELEDFFLKEREKEGDLNERDRVLYEALEEEQEAFRQLKLDVQSITSLDHAIDDALGMLMDQINRARQLEKQAWDNFKEIAHVLNDLKARELYYLMDGAGRNIKNISLYLDNAFSNHFARLIGEAKKHTSRVLNQIKSLKEKGVDFKRQADRIAQQEEQEKQRLEQEQQEEEEAAAKKVKPKQGWFDWIVSFPVKIWNWIKSIVMMPYNLIFGGKK